MNSGLKIWRFIIFENQGVCHTFESKKFTLLLAKEKDMRGRESVKNNPLTQIALEGGQGIFSIKSIGAIPNQQHFQHTRYVLGLEQLCV